MQQLGGFRPAYVELFNEWRQRVIWNLESCMQFTYECTKLFHAVGLRVAGFSNSTGQPEMEDVLYMRNWVAPDKTRAPFAGVDAWSLHEYWGHQGFSTWNALRYRRYHDLLNGQHPPIIITECGRDRVEGGKGGWMNDGLSGDQYLAELLAYNGEIEKDAYVIGATPFTSGPTDDWHAFDMDGISPKIPGGLPPTEVYVPDYNEGGQEVPEDARIQMLLDQNALIVEGFKQILQGKFTGADGLAGTVVALQGHPLDFEVTFPLA